MPRAKRPVISFLPMKDADPEESADLMIAEALRLKFGEEALPIARDQFDRAMDASKDAWKRVVQLLAGD